MHVITNFTARAGAEKMLARLLSVSGDDRVVVVSLMSVSDHNRALANNSNVEFVSLGAKSALHLGRSIFTLAKIIKREKPDVVLCWMYHAMAIGTLAKNLAGSRASLVWTIRQSLDDVTVLSRSTRIALRLCKTLSRWADGAIYNSSRAEGLHQAYGFRVKRSTFIPNGFELPEIGRPTERAPRIFGIAGRFHPQKDHETFFGAAGNALRANPELKFVAVGEGLDADNSAVAEFIDRAGLASTSVDLKGEISDMAEFYRGIDVFVLSSRTEGFPNVIAEAMSQGKPVITTDVGDAASIVGDTGWVVPPRDPAALGGAIVESSTIKPTAYADRCRAARARIEEAYSLRIVAQKYRDFLLGSA